MFIIMKFLLGTCIGSFIYCLVLQLLAGNVNLWRRSHCPHCQHPLRWYDLIPIVSALSLRHRCRYCQQSFSTSHSWAECICGLLWVSLPPLWAMIITLLLAMTYCDWRALLVPDTLQVLLFLACLAQAILSYPDGRTIWYASILFALTFVSYPLIAQYIGGADLKLFVIASLIIPLPYFPLLLFGAGTFGLVHFAALTLWFKKRPHAIPFIPSIALSIICCQLYLLISA